MAFLTDHFRETLEALNENGVKYLIVGGYAVAVHGYIRNTQDIDIFYEKDQMNAYAILAALRKVGVTGGSVELFMEKDAQIQIGDKPDLVDFLGDLPAIEFAKC